MVRLSFEPVPTYASVGKDCDDTDSEIHPDAPITCGERIDRDCDGVEEDLDQDQDGYAWCGECSDLDPRVHPGAIERCNEIDDDCDGVVDGPEADERSWYPDEDADLYGDQDRELISCDPPEDYVVEGGDCDDQNAGVSPVAQELCLNGVDDDCDGLLDGCRLEGELIPSATFLGTADVGIGRDSTLNAVVNAGDMDGDGFDEIAFSSAGRVFVHHGLAGGQGDESVAAGYLAAVFGQGAGLGLVTVGLGDVDGDSRDDLAVTDVYSGNGVVYVLTSETGDLAVADLTTLEGPESSSLFGFGVGRALVGDPLQDSLLVNASDMAADSSTLYSTSLPLISGQVPAYQVVLRGTDGDGVLGIVSWAIDANGDGVQDLATPVSFWGGGRPTVPELRVYLGPVLDRAAADADIVITSAAGFELFASADPLPGDATGDGLDDIWMVAAGEDVRHNDGLAWLLKPTQSGAVEDLSVAQITGDGDDDDVDSLIAEDLDADAQADLLVGFGRADQQPDDDSGSTRLIYGPFQGSIDSNQSPGWYTGTADAWTGRWLVVGNFNRNEGIDLGIASPGGDRSLPSDSRLDLFWDAF